MPQPTRKSTGDAAPVAYIYAIAIIIALVAAALAVAGLVVAAVGGGGSMSPFELGAAGVALLAAACAGVVHLIARRRFEKRLGAPLGALRDATRQLALGGPRNPINIPGSSARELRDVVRAFNDLLFDLEQQRRLSTAHQDAARSREWVAVEAARQAKEEQHKSEVDALTNVFNRRRLELDIDRLVNSAVETRSPLAYVMIDIDHFKRYNDTHGHQEGDTLLSGFAATLGTLLRSGDSLYRYGGEEFAVIMRGTDAANAKVAAERLRAAVEARFSERSVTASFGVAAAPEHGVTPAALIAAADGALYAAKHGGRNRVLIAEAVQPAG